jgi:hypothetical protein
VIIRRYAQGAWESAATRLSKSSSASQVHLDFTGEPTSLHHVDRDCRGAKTFAIAVEMQPSSSSAQARNGDATMSRKIDFAAPAALAAVVATSGAASAQDYGKHIRVRSGHNRVAPIVSVRPGYPFVQIADSWMKRAIRRPANVETKCATSTDRIATTIAHLSGRWVERQSRTFGEGILAALPATARKAGVSA